MSRTLLTLAALGLGTSSVFAQEAVEPLQIAQDAAEISIVGEAPFHASQVIVRLVEGVDLEAAGQLIDGDRYHVIEELFPSLGLYLVLIHDGTRVAAAITELQRFDAVVYAMPDGKTSSRDTTPNDPHFSKLWQHNNNRMETKKAWDLGQGDPGFVISVVDGGIRLSHADLNGNLYVNAAEQGGTPGVDDDGNGYVDDINGWDAYNNDGTIPNDSHGTHCNGIAGAIGNNGVGVTGVAWNCELMPVAGSSGFTSTITKAYNYVYAQKNLWINSGGTSGANVVVTSSSFGIDQGNCNTTYKAWNDLYNKLGTVGILSCGATANANWNIDVVGDTPTGCASQYMVSVTNTTSSDVKNSGAAYGLNTIDLGAPGTSIYSTESNGGYSYKTGTSMATPQVAGAIGLLHSLASPDFQNLRAVDPAGAAIELKTIILNNVDTLSSLTGKTVSGGRLNVWQAAQDISTWTGTPGGGPLDITGVSPSTIEQVVIDGPGVVTLTGTGFTGLTSLVVDGQTLSSAFPPDYTIVDDSTVTFGMPLANALGPVAIIATDASGTDVASITVTANPTPTIELAGSAPGFLFQAIGLDMTLGGQPGDIHFVCASPDLSPTVIPGLLDLGIGAGYTSLFTLAIPAISTKGYAEVLIPMAGLGLPSGFQVHVQSAALLASDGYALPATGSNVQSGTILF